MENNTKIEEIINNHVNFSMIAGAIPIPVIDFITITGIQLDMIKQLSKVFSLDYDSNKGKSIASSIIGSSIARASASAVKSIPGIGTILGITTQVVFSGASTYALGKVFENHYQNDGNLFDINIEKMKDLYKDFFEKGKKIVEDLKNKTTNEDIFTTINKIKKLKEDGTLTEKEFEKLKKDLLSKISE
jgi:uncharacterized protein (DUF697 family)